MSEENKNNKPLELSDEELDSVSGGKALLIHKDNDGTIVWIAKCDRAEITGSDFKGYNHGQNTCPYFKSKSGCICSTCFDCKHHKTFDFTLGKKPDIGDTSGYDKAYC